MAMEAKLNGFSADPNRKIIPTEIETKDTTSGMVSSTNTVKKTTFGDDGVKGKTKVVCELYVNLPSGTNKPPFFHGPPTAGAVK